MVYAPIVLFVYKRLDTLMQCVHSLEQNALCSESELFVFSDAAAGIKDVEKVEAVRSYLNTLKGFKKVTIIHSDTNKGLAQSIIAGVNDVINQFGKVIVLEDDLIVSKNFLCFMNKALDFYTDEEKVLSISGFTLPIKLPNHYTAEVYFTKRVFSWGWATWKHKWNGIDWTVADYDTFKGDKAKQKAFNAMGSDLSSMLQHQIEGKISSWAVRWCYHQFKHGLFTVFPIHSKVLNNGFNADATHSGLNNKRYRTSIQNEDQTQFVFTKEVKLNKRIIKQFIRHFSIPVRAYYKLSASIYKVFNSR